MNREYEGVRTRVGSDDTESHRTGLVSSALQPHPVRISETMLVGSVIAHSGKIVERERHLVAVDMYLKNAIHRLPELRQFIERTTEQPLLLHAVDARDDDDQACVQRLCCIEPAEVAGVVCE
jgi:hypothetical protein